MTAVVALRGTQLFVEVETSEGSGVFAHPCLINGKRGIVFNANTNKQIIPDCDNPDDPAWQRAIKDAISAAIDGAGKFDNKAETISFYNAWLLDKDTRNVRVRLGTVGYWAGAFHLTKWEVGGDRNEYADSSVSLENDGAIAWTAT